MSYEIAPFQPLCYFCDDEVAPIDKEGSHQGAYVTFKSGHQAFLCEEHYARAQVHDQCTEARLVETGIARVLAAREVPR